jgi:hypothetical protein
MKMLLVGIGALSGVIGARLIAAGTPVWMTAAPFPAEARVDVFFYGLFMDEKVLEANGVVATARRIASVRDFAIRIGRRATLVREPGARAHGVVFALTHGELERLYGDVSLRDYKPEAILCELSDGTSAAALCYNLPTAPPEGERNAEYATKLAAVARRAALPDDYIGQILRQ